MWYVLSQQPQKLVQSHGCVGPLVWGPLSELYGRRWPLMIGCFLFAIFNIPVAVAHNLPTILICRFFAGAFAAAPLAIVPGLYVDIWSVADRGIAASGLLGCVFAGPVIGPIIGDYVVLNPHMGWRWVSWLMFILAIAVWAVAMATVPETWAPKILQNKAARMRRRTFGHVAYYAPLDEHPVKAKELIQRYLFRPLHMLALEPIVRSSLPPPPLYSRHPQD